jgi:hypothetical protein
MIKVDLANIISIGLMGALGTALLIGGVKMYQNATGKSS